MGWSPICFRFSQFEPEIMLDGILNFKTHFMVWYCVWYEHCNGLFNIRNLVSRLILMFVRICFCDAILYTWFEKKWKLLKKFWGWKICLVYAYFLKHLSSSILVSLSFMLMKCILPSHFRSRETWKYWFKEGLIGGTMIMTLMRDNVTEIKLNIYGWVWLINEAIQTTRQEFFFTKVASVQSITDIV